jgi:hypothetical protein
MTMPICARPRIAKCMARASVPRFWSGLFALGLCYCVQVSAKASSAAGIVLEQDGKPVPGAIVLSAGNREGFAPSFQRPGEGVLGITDSRGRWSLTNAPERLIITHPDYLRETVFAASEVTLLRNGIKLSGVVTDLSGRGIEGARILGGDFPLWTPSGGRFEFRNCRPGRMVLVAEAPGYAASWIEPATRDDTPELRWMLHPSITNRLLVVDTSNRAVSDAEMTVENWGAPVPWDWRWRTDTNGLVLWANAPTGEVMCAVMKRGYRSLSGVRLVAGRGNQKVTIRGERTIHGFVRDERGQPIQTFSVLPSEQRGENDFWVGERADKETRAGEFVLPLPGPAPAFVTISAPGFESALSRRVEPEEEAVSLQFALRRTKHISGDVRDANGELLANAQVVWASAETKAVLAQGSFMSNSLVKATFSDKAGHFELQAPRSATWLFAAKADYGFGALPLDEARETNGLILGPWGGLEGRAEFTGSAQSQRFVALVPLGFTNLLLHQSEFTAMTDEAGRFGFQMIPPGLHRVGRIVRGFLSHTVDVEVNPGLIQRIKIGGPGTRVIGRLHLPGAEPFWADTTVPAGLRMGSVVYEFDFNETNAPGAFYVDSVPPGAYELEAHWHELNPARDREICHGAWRTNVLVPPRAEVDLGDLYWQPPAAK